MSPSLLSHGMRSLLRPSLHGLKEETGTESALGTPALTHRVPQPRVVTWLVATPGKFGYRHGFFKVPKPLDAGFGWHHEIAGRFAPLIFCEPMPKVPTIPATNRPTYGLDGYLGWHVAIFQVVAKIDGLLWFT